MGRNPVLPKPNDPKRSDSCLIRPSSSSLLTFLRRKETQRVRVQHRRENGGGGAIATGRGGGGGGSDPRGEGGCARADADEAGPHRRLRRVAALPLSPLHHHFARLPWRVCP